MIVYRVECSASKKGMYCWYGHSVAIRNCDERNPGTYMDFGNEIYNRVYSGNNHMRHGFTSISMLWRWFHKTEANLRDTVGPDKCWPGIGTRNELVIARYDVPDEHVHIGRCQVVFDERYARALKCIDVEDVITMALAGSEELPLHEQAVPEVISEPSMWLKAREWVLMNQHPKSARKYG